MKHKFLKIALTISAVLCLGAGLAACGGGDPNEAILALEPTVTVGKSAEKLVNADLKGFVLERNSPYVPMVRGDYAQNSYDIVEVNSNQNYVNKVNYRDGTCFLRTTERDLTDLTWQNAEFGSLTYLPNPSSVTSCPTPLPRAAAYGFAFLLSGTENFMAFSNQIREIELEMGRNQNRELYDIPADGLWTGEIKLYGYADSYYFTPSVWREGTFDEAIRKVPFFRFATAPLTQEQLKEFFTAVSGLDTEIGEVCGKIVECGEIVEGQSSYEYFVNAVEEAYGDGGFSSFESTFQYWRNLPWAVMTLALGGDYTSMGLMTSYVATFNAQGELVSVRDSATAEEEHSTVRFTADPALDDIDDETVNYLVTDEQEEVTTMYRATASEFMQKPLEEIPNMEVVPLDSLCSSLGDLNTSLSYYVDGEEFVQATYFYDRGTFPSEYFCRCVCAKYTVPMFGESWGPGSRIWFREEEDGTWAYKAYGPLDTWRAYVEHDGNDHKAKMDRPSYLIDTSLECLCSLTQAEFSLFSLAEEEAYYNEIWEHDNILTFDVDGISCRMNVADLTCTYEYDGVPVTVKIIGQAGWELTDPETFIDVSDLEAPSKENYKSALARCVSPKTVALNGTYRLNLEEKECVSTDYPMRYYKMENGELKEYVQENGAWTKHTSEDTYMEMIIDYPLHYLTEEDYDSFTYVAFDEMFYLRKGDIYYGIHLSDLDTSRPTVDYIVTYDCNTHRYYGFYLSDFNGVAYAFPEVIPVKVDVEQAVEDSFRATSYEVKISATANNFILDEKIDFNNQIIYMTVTNANGDASLALYRAVSENRCWVYSDASGAWLRAETKGDPATLISAANELSGLKAALDELRSSSSYTIPWNEYTDTYTIGDYTVTVENGRIATLRHGSGLAAVRMTFSHYNNSSLTLPELGTVDAAAKEKFITAMNNTIHAANFHVDWEMDGATYSSDVVAGEKALTKISTNAGDQTTVIGEIYREVNGSKVDMWTRQRSTMLSWGSWSKSSYSGTEEEIKTDLFLQNVVFAATLGSTPDLVYILSKYDAATDTYTMRDFNFATMNVVESTFKIENGYVTEWTTKSRDMLAAIGASGNSITFRYSNFGNTWVTKPTGIS